MNVKKILDGMVVLDLTRFFSGPQCTLLLAAMGAEVIKIDDPASGDPTAGAPPFAGPKGVSLQRQTDEDFGIAYLKRARNKKSMTLNLKSDAGREILLSMIGRADVLVENFSVGVTDRLGLDYETLKQRNPALVHCSLTGYGTSGPDATLKAYDLMVQAATGLMGITGEPDGPPLKAGSPISDAVAGVFAAMGVVSALLHRLRTGEGQSIDVSMADCLFSVLFDEPLDCYAALGLASRQGSRIMRFSPFNAYRALDGWVTLGAATSADWLALLEVLGRQDLKDDRDMMLAGWRIANNARVDAVVDSWTSVRDSADIVSRMRAAGVPCSPVRTIDDVLRWPHLRARGMVDVLRHPRGGVPLSASGPGFPIKFGRTPAQYDVPAPLPGAHTAEILRRFAGLASADIEALRSRGVI